MSEHFDSDDPFADFTAADLDNIEHAAMQATQNSQPAPIVRAQRPLNRATSYQPPIAERDETLGDDYGQFNVDDQDLVLDDAPPDPPLASPSQAPPSSHSALLSELSRLRAEAARLKAERDKFETKAYSQDGKLDHLQRTLSRTQNEHNAALQRLANVNDAEKRALREEIDERERRLARIVAELEFQKSEAREARERRNGVAVSVPPAIPGNVVVNGEGSPKKARVVRGSGIKSPESKSRIGVAAARAFGKEVVQQKKRKRDEQVTEVAVPMQVEEKVSESEINRLVVEKIIQSRSMWSPTDERFEVLRLME
jgi:hypothetical protein